MERAHDNNVVRWLSMKMNNRAAVVSLILGRVVYAVNWYNMAAVFALTASELKQNVSGLGARADGFEDYLNERSNRKKKLTVE